MPGGMRRHPGAKTVDTPQVATIIPYNMRHDKLLMDHVALHKQLRMKTTLEQSG